MNEILIDEASLERQCVRLIQAVDRGSHCSVEGEGQRVDVSVQMGLGWMYMDLERAVIELRGAVELRQDDGLIPNTADGRVPATPLLASLIRMVYHAARGRQRSLEGDLAAFVPHLDLYHAWLGRHLSRGLYGSQQGEVDDRILGAAVSPAPSDDPVARVGFLSLLVQAETDLADVALHTGFPTRQIIARRMHLAQAVDRHLWWDDRKIYASRSKASWIEPLTADSLLPLWAGAAPKQRAMAMVNRYLAGGDRFWGPLPLTSVQAAPDEDTPTPRPLVNPWLNWLLIRGLMRYGQDAMARTLNDTVLHLVSQHGMWEAFDADTGAGAGQPDSPLTAAVVLDLVKTPFYYERW